MSIVDAARKFLGGYSVHNGQCHCDGRASQGAYHATVLKPWQGPPYPATYSSWTVRLEGEQRQEKS